MIYKSKIKYLPIFLKKIENENEQLQKKDLNSLKSLFIQFYILIIRYLIPMLLLFFIAHISDTQLKYGITDVYLYANGLAVVTSLYLSYKINTINYNTIYYVGVLHLVVFILLRFNLNISIFSINHFLLYFACLLPIYWLTAWIVKDLFIYQNFSQFYLNQNGQFILQVKKLRIINKILLAFFLIVSTLFIGMCINSGIEITKKKYEIYQKYFTGKKNENSKTK